MKLTSRPERKIVQIAVSPPFGDDGEDLIVLCNDGTVWRGRYHPERVVTEGILWSQVNTHTVTTTVIP